MKHAGCRALCYCALVTVGATSAAAQQQAPIASAPLGPRTVGQTPWTPAPDPPSSAGSPSLGWLVGSLVQDFKRLPSGDAAALLAIGATGALFSASADQPSSRLLSRSNTLD